MRRVLLAIGCSLFAVSGCAGRSTSNDSDGGGRAATGGRGTGGSSGTAGSAQGGGAGTGPSVDECLFDGKRYADGTSFTNDCNVCSCDFPEVTCTTRDCSGGTGGVAGTGGTSGGRGGSGGESGEPSCTYADIGAFCVLGNPIDSGDQLVPGTPLRISLQPSGCHSSSCTRVVSSVCSYLASEGDIMVSPFLCLREEGDACTDDCGGGSAECDVGLMLGAGTNRVSIAGTPLQVTFTVPSVAKPGALCTGSANDP